MLGGTNGEFEYYMVDDTDIVGVVWMMNKSQFNGQHWEYCLYQIAEKTEAVSFSDNYGTMLNLHVDNEVLFANLDDSEWTKFDITELSETETNQLYLDVYVSTACIANENSENLYELPIPQVEVDGKMVDNVDRVQWLVDFCESLNS